MIDDSRHYCVIMIACIAVTETAARLKLSRQADTAMLFAGAVARAKWVAIKHSLIFSPLLPCQPPSQPSASVVYERQDDKTRCNRRRGGCRWGESCPNYTPLAPALHVLVLNMMHGVSTPPHFLPSFKRRLVRHRSGSAGGSGSESRVSSLPRTSNTPPSCKVCQKILRYAFLCPPYLVSSLKSVLVLPVNYEGTAFLPFFSVGAFHGGRKLKSPLLTAGGRTYSRRSCPKEGKYCRLVTIGYCEEIKEALNIEVLRADEVWSSNGMKGRGNGRSPRKLADQRHCRAGFPHAIIRSDPAMPLQDYCTLLSRTTFMYEPQIKNDIISTDIASYTMRKATNDELNVDYATASTVVKSTCRQNCARRIRISLCKRGLRDKIIAGWWAWYTDPLISTEKISSSRRTSGLDIRCPSGGKNSTLSLPRQGDARSSATGGEDNKCFPFSLLTAREEGGALPPLTGLTPRHLAATLDGRRQAPLQGNILPPVACTSHAPARPPQRRFLHHFRNQSRTHYDTRVYVVVEIDKSQMEHSRCHHDMYSTLLHIADTSSVACDAGYRFVHPPHPNTPTKFPAASSGSNNNLFKLLAYHLGETGSIPGGVAPDFRTRESCRTMPLVGGFSRGSPVTPPFHSGASPYSPHFLFIGSQNLDVKCRPNRFTHSLSCK
ncbi:hypothetical protein PR048_020254 [Dryococelus australis]|uniref:Uncharacterized protein n=1 Tax=Dryococelus australis TaxID=614101 RepID=A0ABQ9H5S3_9NEOP|nr:hypothetical protein PR048_020254 [Dryococelus australis]